MHIDVSKNKNVKNVSLVDFLIFVGVASNYYLYCGLIHGYAAFMYVQTSRMNTIQRK